MKNLLNIFKNHYISIAFFLAISLFLGIFGSILEDVWTNEKGINAFDLNILQNVAAHRTDFLNNFFIFITNFGSIEYVCFFAVILSVILIYKKKYNYLISLITLLTGAGILVFTIKDVVKRARPEIMNAVIPENGFSFPSGHTFLSLVFYGLLTYFIFKNVKNIFLKALTLVIGAKLILVISFSRIYLGVHWTSDVIASFLLASVLLSLVIYYLERK